MAEEQEISLNPLDWLREGMRWYWRERYSSVLRNEPTIVALAAYNLQRRKNQALRRGRIEDALAYADQLDQLFISWGLVETEAEPTQEEVPALALVETLPSSELPPFLSPDEALEAVGDVYWVDAAFLVACWRWLVQVDGELAKAGNWRRSPVGIEPEWACLVTGPRLKEIRALSQMVPVRFTHQSAAKLAMEVDDFNRALRGLQRWGYSLHAVFHSHRFNGRVFPSQIDLDTQLRLLEPVYPAIQAVFSEDGYVRFFSVERPFTVEVFGRGVEHVEDTLYCLDEGLREAALADAVWSPLVPTG